VSSYANIHGNVEGNYFVASLEILRKLAAFLRPFWEARMRDVPNCFQFSDK
jgi:hypothetical protein